MHRLTRRELLKLSASAAVALGTSQILTGCSDEETPPKPTSTPAGPSTRVAAIKGSDLYAMTRDALEAIGGIGAIVHEGETVFIKPNMVMLPWADVLGSPFPTGECTEAGDRHYGRRGVPQGGRRRGDHRRRLAGADLLLGVCCDPRWFDESRRRGGAAELTVQRKGAHCLSRHRVSRLGGGAYPTYLEKVAIPAWSPMLTA